MHTTEQAKKLWCPQVRTFDEGSQGALPFNRPFIEGIEKHDCNCISLHCAMWRWSAEPILQTWTSLRDERLSNSETAKEATSNPPITDDIPKPHGEGWEPVGIPSPDEEGDPLWVQRWKRDIESARTGYCGLAGSPNV
jgi:hypothetical protein